VQSRQPLLATKYDELDRSIGVLLISLVPAVGVAIDQRPEPLIRGVFGADHLSVGSELIALEPDPDGFTCLDVVKPSRRSVGAAVGCSDDERAILVSCVDERCCSFTPRATTGSGEQQCRDTNQPMPENTSGRLIDRLMKLQHSRFEGHGRTVVPAPVAVPMTVLCTAGPVGS